MPPRTRAQTKAIAIDMVGNPKTQRGKKTPIIKLIKDEAATMKRTQSDETKPDGVPVNRFWTVRSGVLELQFNDRGDPVAKGQENPEKWDLNELSIYSISEIMTATVDAHEDEVGADDMINTTDMDAVICVLLKCGKHGYQVAEVFFNLFDVLKHTKTKPINAKNLLQVWSTSGTAIDKLDGVQKNVLVNCTMLVSHKIGYYLGKLISTRQLYANVASKANSWWQTGMHGVGKALSKVFVLESKQVAKDALRNHEKWARHRADLLDSRTEAEQDRLIFEEEAYNKREKKYVEDMEKFNQDREKQAKQLNKTIEELNSTRERLSKLPNMPLVELPNIEPIIPVSIRSTWNSEIDRLNKEYIKTQSEPVKSEDLPGEVSLWVIDYCMKETNTITDIVRKNIDSVVVKKDEHGAKMCRDVGDINDIVEQEWENMRFITPYTPYRDALLSCRNKWDKDERCEWGATDDSCLTTANNYYKWKCGDCDDEQSSPCPVNKDGEPDEQCDRKGISIIELFSLLRARDRCAERAIQTAIEATEDSKYNHNDWEDNIQGDIYGSECAYAQSAIIKSKEHHIDEELKVSGGKKGLTSSLYQILTNTLEYLRLKEIKTPTEIESLASWWDVAKDDMLYFAFNAPSVSGFNTLMHYTVRDEYDFYIKKSENISARFQHANHIQRIMRENDEKKQEIEARLEDIGKEGNILKKTHLEHIDRYFINNRFTHDQFWYTEKDYFRDFTNDGLNITVKDFVNNVYPALKVYLHFATVAAPPKSRTDVALTIDKITHETTFEELISETDAHWSAVIVDNHMNRIQSQKQIEDRDRISNGEYAVGDIIEIFIDNSISPGNDGSNTISVTGDEPHTYEATDDSVIGYWTEAKIVGESHEKEGSRIIKMNWMGGDKAVGGVRRKDKNDNIIWKVGDRVQAIDVLEEWDGADVKKEWRDAEIIKVVDRRRGTAGFGQWRAIVDIIWDLDRTIPTTNFYPYDTPSVDSRHKDGRNTAEIRARDLYRIQLPDNDRTTDPYGGTPIIQYVPPSSIRPCDNRCGVDELMDASTGAVAGKGHILEPEMKKDKKLWTEQEITQKLGVSPYLPNDSLIAGKGVNMSKWITRSGAAKLYLKQLLFLSFGMEDLLLLCWLFNKPASAPKQIFAEWYVGQLNERNILASEKPTPVELQKEIDSRWYQLTWEDEIIKNIQQTGSVDGGKEHIRDRNRALQRLQVASDSLDVANDAWEEGKRTNAKHSLRATKFAAETEMENAKKNIDIYEKEDAAAIVNELKAEYAKIQDEYNEWTQYRNVLLRKLKTSSKSNPLEEYPWLNYSAKNTRERLLNKIDPITRKPLTPTQLDLRILNRRRIDERVTNMTGTKWWRDAANIPRVLNDIRDTVVDKLESRMQIDGVKTSCIIESKLDMCDKLVEYQPVSILRFIGGLLEKKLWEGGKGHKWREAWEDHMRGSADDPLPLHSIGEIISDLRKKDHITPTDVLAPVMAKSTETVKGAATAMGKIWNMGGEKLSESATGQGMIRRKNAMLSVTTGIFGKQDASTLHSVSQSAGGRVLSEDSRPKLAEYLVNKETDEDKEYVTQLFDKHNEEWNNLDAERFKEYMDSETTNQRQNASNKEREQRQEGVLAVTNEKEKAMKTRHRDALEGAKGDVGIINKTHVGIMNKLEELQESNKTARAELIVIRNNVKTAREDYNNTYKEKQEANKQYELIMAKGLTEGRTPEKKLKKQNALCTSINDKLVKLHSGLRPLKKSYTTKALSVHTEYEEIQKLLSQINKDKRAAVTDKKKMDGYVKIAALAEQTVETLTYKKQQEEDEWKKLDQASDAEASEIHRKVMLGFDMQIEEAAYKEAAASAKAIKSASHYAKSLRKLKENSMNPDEKMVEQVKVQHGQEQLRDAEKALESSQNEFRVIKRILPDTLKDMPLPARDMKAKEAWDSMEIGTGLRAGLRVFREEIHKHLRDAGRFRSPSGEIVGNICESKNSIDSVDDGVTWVKKFRSDLKINSIVEIIDEDPKYNECHVDTNQQQLCTPRLALIQDIRVVDDNVYDEWDTALKTNSDGSVKKVARHGVKGGINKNDTEGDELEVHSSLSEKKGIEYDLIEVIETVTGEYERGTTQFNNLNASQLRSTYKPENIYHATSLSLGPRDKSYRFDLNAASDLFKAAEIGQPYPPKNTDPGPVSIAVEVDPIDKLVTPGAPPQSPIIVRNLKIHGIITGKGDYSDPRHGRNRPLAHTAWLEVRMNASQRSDYIYRRLCPQYYKPVVGKGNKICCVYNSSLKLKAAANVTGAIAMLNAFMWSPAERELLQADISGLGQEFDKDGNRIALTEVQLAEGTEKKNRLESEYKDDYKVYEGLQVKLAAEDGNMTNLMIKTAVVYMDIWMKTKFFRGKKAQAREMRDGWAISLKGVKRLMRGTFESFHKMIFWIMRGPKMAIILLKLALAIKNQLCRHISSKMAIAQLTSPMTYEGQAGEALTSGAMGAGKLMQAVAVGLSGSNTGGLVGEVLKKGVALWEVGTTEIPFLKLLPGYAGAVSMCSQVLLVVLTEASDAVLFKISVTEGFSSMLKLINPYDCIKPTIVTDSVKLKIKRVKKGRAGWFGAKGTDTIVEEELELPMSEAVAQVMSEVRENNLEGNVSTAEIKQRVMRGLLETGSLTIDDMSTAKRAAAENLIDQIILEQQLSPNAPRDGLGTNAMGLSAHQRINSNDSMGQGIAKRLGLVAYKPIVLDSADDRAHRALPMPARIAKNTAKAAAVAAVETAKAAKLAAELTAKGAAAGLSVGLDYVGIGSAAKLRADAYEEVMRKAGYSQSGGNIELSSDMGLLSEYNGSSDDESMSAE